MKNQLDVWGVDTNNMRGQGYDGAGNMAGKVKGVKSRFLQENNQALYFHCASHCDCLNLCIVKACNLPAIKTMMGNLRELALFFSNSPKRQRKLDEVINEAAPDTKKNKLRDLCKTRWVERHEALETFTDLHPVVHDCLGQMYEDNDEWEWDGETTTKAAGLLNAVTTSTFLVAFVVVRKCLHYFKCLTVQLQKKNKEIVSAYKQIQDVTATIESIRADTDTAFTPWFTEAEAMAATFSTDIAVTRKACRQILRDNHPAGTPEEYFKRSVAIPFLDHLCLELRERFQNAELASDALSLVPATFAHGQRGV